MFAERMVKLYMQQEDTFVPEAQWMSVAGYFALVFRVKACKNVRLALAEIEGIYSDHSH